MMPRIPPCDACGSKAASRVAYAVHADHIIDIYNCPVCLKTFEVRTDDPRDDRRPAVRNEGDAATTRGTRRPLR